MHVAGSHWQLTCQCFDRGETVLIVLWPTVRIAALCRTCVNPPLTKSDSN